MSNALSVRRVQVQTLNEKGESDGPPTFGVMASDSYAMKWNDTFESFQELETAIQESKSILDVIDNSKELFFEADHQKIGHDNFYGNLWKKDDE